jgi:hypothetical protein
MTELRKDREKQSRGWEDNKLELQKDREANKIEFDRAHKEIMAVANKQERAVGALGARWGLQSEATFRNALTGILEKSFAVEAMNVAEYDDEGIVYGQISFTHFRASLTTSDDEPDRSIIKERA